MWCLRVHLHQERGEAMRSTGHWVFQAFHFVLCVTGSSWRAFVLLILFIYLFIHSEVTYTDLYFKKITLTVFFLRMWGRGGQNGSRENSLDAIRKAHWKMVGSGQNRNLFWTIGAVRLADGIIGNTCNFIIQSGILLSMKGDFVTNYARTGTHRDGVRQTSTYGKRKKKERNQESYVGWQYQGSI